jgi:hypothetical protein
VEKITTIQLGTTQSDLQHEVFEIELIVEMPAMVGSPSRP